MNEVIYQTFVGAANAARVKRYFRRLDTHNSNAAVAAHVAALQAPRRSHHLMQTRMESRLLFFVLSKNKL
jgi:hypothetical protein